MCLLKDEKEAWGCTRMLDLIITDDGVDFRLYLSNNFDLFSAIELRPESVWWFAQKNKIDEYIIIQVTFVCDYVSFD